MVGLTAAFLYAGGSVLGVKPQPFGGVDMDDDRVVDILDLAERLHERGHIVAVLDIPVIKAERVENIGLRGAIGCAQPGELPVHAAEILGNGHLVVVDDDDHIRALPGRVVEPLEGDGAAQ